MQGLGLIHTITPVDKVAYRNDNDRLSNIHMHTLAISAPTVLGAQTSVRSGGSEIFPLGSLRCDVPSVSGVLCLQREAERNGEISSFRAT